MSDDLLVITKDGIDKANASADAFARIWQDRGYYIYAGALEELIFGSDPSGALLAYAELAEDFSVSTGSAATTPPVESPVYNLVLPVNHQDRRPFALVLQALVANSTAGAGTTLRIQRMRPDIDVGWTIVHTIPDIRTSDGTGHYKLHWEMEEFLDPGVYVYQLLVSRTTGTGVSKLLSATNGITARTRMWAVQR